MKIFEAMNPLSSAIPSGNTDSAVTRNNPGLAQMCSPFPKKRRKNNWTLKQMKSQNFWLLAVISAKICILIFLELRI